MTTLSDVVSSRMHVHKAIATRVDGWQGQDNHATGSVLVFRLGKNGVGLYIQEATSALVTSFYKCFCFCSEIIFC